METDEIHINDIIPNFETKAINLAADGKISRTARNQKINFQEEMEARIKGLPANMIGEPTITLLKEGEEVMNSRAIKAG